MTLDELKSLEYIDDENVYVQIKDVYLDVSIFVYSSYKTFEFETSEICDEDAEDCHFKIILEDDEIQFLDINVSKKLLKCINLDNMKIVKYVPSSEIFDPECVVGYIIENETIIQKRYKHLTESEQTQYSIHYKTEKCITVTDSRWNRQSCYFSKKDLILSIIENEEYKIKKIDKNIDSLNKQKSECHKTITIYESVLNNES